MFFAKLSFYQDLHYLDSLTIKLALNLLLYSIVLLISSFIIEFILRYFLHPPTPLKYKKAPSNELVSMKMKDLESNQGQNTIWNSEDSDLGNQNLVSYHRSKQEKIWICFFILSKIILSAGFIFMAFIPCFFSGSGRIHVLLSFMWAFFVLNCLLCYLLYSIFFSKEDESKRPLQSKWIQICWTLRRNIGIFKRNYRKWFVLSTVAIAFFSAFIPFATTGLCVSTFSDQYGFYWLEVRRVSSTFTRWFEINKVCPPGPPCHMYTTVPEDTSKAFFLNVHTHTDVNQLTVYYEEKSIYEKTNSTSMQKIADYFPFTGAESLGHRNVHSVYIDDLKPDTEYYLSVHYDGMKQAENYYKTLPDGKFQNEIRIAMGGDVGSNYTVRDMNMQIANYNPDILIIAGDAGYDDGLASCYYSWDLFFWYFEEMYEKVGRLIPMVVGIGNHDIGYNALANPQITPSEEGPLFYIFLPQNLPQNQKGETEDRVPGLLERKPYFNHIVGNTIHLSLDSGYLTPYEGDQQLWIEEVVQKNKDKARFANYHVPVYPACFKPAIDDDRPPKLTEKYWIPLFEKFKFMTVFENHVHFYKRTKPLLGGKVDPKGIIYLGDGAWGILPNYCTGTNKPRHSELQIYEKTGSLNHVWILTINQTTVKYEPLGIDGKLIEETFYKNMEEFTLS